VLIRWEFEERLIAPGSPILPHQAYKNVYPQGYLLLKSMTAGEMLYAYNLNTQRAEAEESQVQGQPGLPSEILFQQTQKS
jgi:hypothetical protein